MNKYPNLRRLVAACGLNPNWQALLPSREGRKHLAAALNLTTEETRLFLEAAGKTLREIAQSLREKGVE